jgi:hypothetical protein
MSYGLRRYETIHRLWWFVFFILCLLVARYSQSFTYPSQHGPELKDLRKIDFWTGLQGIGMTSPGFEDSRAKQGRQNPAAMPQPGKPDAPGMKKKPAEPSTGQDDLRDNIELVSGMLLFLIQAGIIFLELRLLWLAIQYAARYLLQLIMSDSDDPGPLSLEAARTRPGSLFPGQVLFDKIRRSPMSVVLHPFIRLRLILSGIQRNVSSEDLFEKERRIVEADWQILNGSWGPFSCLLWILPILGLAQTALLLVAQFNAASPALAIISPKETIEAAKPLLGISPQKEILDSIKPTMNLLLPLIQATGLAIFFQWASTLLKYFEELYLSNLDTFIYDRLLSRLPLRSNDTVLILETLQRQFRDLQTAVKKLEEKIFSKSEVGKQT